MFSVFRLFYENIFSVNSKIRAINLVFTTIRLKIFLILENKNRFLSVIFSFSSFLSLLILRHLNEKPLKFYVVSFSITCNGDS